MKRAMTLLAMAGIVGIALGMVALSRPYAADAQQERSATRSFSETRVAPGDEITVTLTVDFPRGEFFRLIETLPAGFAYVSGSASGQFSLNEQAKEITFIDIGPQSLQITYNVTASGTAGNHRFFGGLGGAVEPRATATLVGGASTITVTAAASPSPGTPPRPATASALRSFSPDPAEPGAPVTVTITPARLGGFGILTETLPAGFSYVSSSLRGSRVEEDGQNVTFTLVNEEPFTYTVNASSSTGNHQFSGVLLNADRMTIDVGGDTSLSVERTGAPPAPLLPPPPPVEASTARSLSQATVDGGAPVVVTVIPAGLGGFGSLAETLPAGFSYVSSSLRDNRVEEDGQTVTFTLLNEDPFTYTVTASGVDGLYTFTGVLTDGDKVTHDIPDSIIRVGPEPTPVTPEASTTRSLSQTMVDGGATVVITIIPAGLGGFGSLVETLPAGFSYDSSNLSDNRVEEDGQTVTFTLLNEDPFTYTVTASSVDGLYTFTGVLTDGDKVAHNIADSTIRVGPEPTPVTSEPTPVKPEATPEPTPTRRISTSIRRSSGGVAIIIPAAPTPTLEPTPAPTPTPAPATPNPTAEIIMVKGLEGERGEPGPEGERGEPGLPGRMGETGEQGPAGQLGVTGATGVGGSFGPAGSEGQDGLPGAEGAPGPKGPDGPEGPAGEPGSAGNDGVTGPPGSKVSILYIAALIISIVALAASAGRLLDLYMEKKAKNNLP